MPYADSAGFTSRSDAEKQFGRSRSSFIRDIEEAFTNSNEEFLQNFCVFLNDETKLVGTEATKSAVDNNRKKQPRWFIKTSLLETRYWEKKETDPEQGSTPSSKQEQKQPPERTTGKLEDVELQHQLEIAKERLHAKETTITRLEEDKQFLQAELSHRRGEIDRLREFISSVGDSAAKLKGGESDQGKKQNDTPTVAVDVEVVKPKSSAVKREQSASNNKNGTRSAAEKYVPTVYKAIKFFRKNDA